VLARRYRRKVAWLALLALWFQVAFVFPHICPDDIAGLGHTDTRAALASAKGDDAPLCPLSDGRGGNACLVYGSAHQAGSPLLPDGAIVCPTALRDLKLAFGGTAFRLAPAPYLIFQTRAPPAL
jgi:hypothetical protein